jgi:hypothetical protein
MTKRKGTAAKGAKAGAFVLGKGSFAKISAVEGIHLTDAMKKRGSVARAKKLSPDEYRETIIRSHRKG